MIDPNRQRIILERLCSALQSSISADKPAIGLAREKLRSALARAPSDAPGTDEYFAYREKILKKYEAAIERADRVVDLDDE